MKGFRYRVGGRMGVWYLRMLRDVEDFDTEKKGWEENNECEQARMYITADRETERGTKTNQSAKEDFSEISIPI